MIELNQISLDEEWIVDKVITNTIGKIFIKPIGKIFVKPTLHLNNQQLEQIWDFCNYGPVGYGLKPIIENCIYNGRNAIISEDMIYIPLSDDDYCNNDIFIRKHFKASIENNGYWICNKNRTTKDTWVYTSKKEFIDYIKKQITL